MFLPPQGVGITRLLSAGGRQKQIGNEKKDFRENDMKNMKRFFSLLTLALLSIALPLTVFCFHVFYNKKYLVLVKWLFVIIQVLKFSFLKSRKNYLHTSLLNKIHIQDIHNQHDFLKYQNRISHLLLFDPFFR